MLFEAGRLHAQSVDYAYGDVEVVQQATFMLKRGEMAALAGPNGSGKTTLLKVLSGVLHPKSGRVLLDDTDLADVAPRRVASHIAVVAQHVDPSLMFSVEDIVAMGRTPYASLFGSRTQVDRQAVRNALEAADVTRLGHRRFGELSGGEQQRVMVAMALAQQTSFLLLDEPTVHLDLHHQFELLELLVTLRKRLNIGVLAVMHDLNLAALYFERLALMQDGRLVADGPTEMILRDERSMSIFRAPMHIVTHPQTGIAQVLLARKAADLDHSQV
jgi:iron complex transport system ATP-binding protein